MRRSADARNFSLQSASLQVIISDLVLLKIQGRGCTSGSLLGLACCSFQGQTSWQMSQPAIQSCNGNGSDGSLFSIV
jgi:hypothetical protein